MILEWGDEQILIEQARGGDEQAFGSLVTRHLQPAFAIAFRILRNREDAEDAVQEAFVAALVNLERFEPSRAFGPWISRIVERKSLNALEKRRVRDAEPLRPDHALHSSAPDRDTERSDLAGRLRSALAWLSPRQRRVIQMVELEGYSTLETATILGITPATTRWHLHAARGSLSQLLQALNPFAD